MDSIRIFRSLRSSYTRARHTRAARFATLSVAASMKAAVRHAELTPPTFDCRPWLNVCRTTTSAIRSDHMSQSHSSLVTHAPPCSICSEHANRTAPRPMPISVIARPVLARLGLTPTWPSRSRGAWRVRRVPSSCFPASGRGAGCRARGAEPCRNLRADLHRRAECPLVLDDRAEAHAVNELGDQIVQAVEPGVSRTTTHPGDSARRRWVASRRRVRARGSARTWRSNFCGSAGDAETHGFGVSVGEGAWRGNLTPGGTRTGRRAAFVMSVCVRLISNRLRHLNFGSRITTVHGGASGKGDLSREAFREFASPERMHAIRVNEHTPQALVPLSPPRCSLWMSLVIDSTDSHAGLTRPSTPTFLEHSCFLRPKVCMPFALTRGLGNTYQRAAAKAPGRVASCFLKSFVLGRHGTSGRLVSVAAWVASRLRARSIRCDGTRLARSFSMHLGRCCGEGGLSLRQRALCREPVTPNLFSVEARLGSGCGVSLRRNALEFGCRFESRRLLKCVVWGPTTRMGTLG